MATKTSSKSFAKVRKDIENWNNKFVGVISARITNDVAEVASDLIYEKRQAFISSLQHDHQNREDFEVSIVKHKSGCQIRVVGDQVLYEEYGTGIMGRDNTHDNKLLYGMNLNPYLHNEGKVNPKSPSGLDYIKYDRNGRPYWTYFSTEKGDYTSTYGIPPGCYVFNTFNEMTDVLAARIAKERIAKSAREMFKL